MSAKEPRRVNPEVPGLSPALVNVFFVHPNLVNEKGYEKTGQTGPGTGQKRDYTLKGFDKNRVR